MFIRKAALVTLIVCVVFYWATYFSFSYTLWTKLPEWVETDEIIYVNRSGWLFGPSCDTGVFQIAFESLYQLDREGHTLLEADGSRWSDTPMPNDWFGTGSWMYCYRGMSPLLVRTINAAAQRTGSFYLRQDNKIVLVIPYLNLVVYSYYDN